MIVSADRTGAFAGSPGLALRRRSHITKPVAPSAGTAAVVSPSASANAQAPCPVWRNCAHSPIRSIAVVGAKVSVEPVDGSTSASPSDVRRRNTPDAAPRAGKVNCLRSATSASARAARPRIGAAGPPLAAIAGGAVSGIGMTPKVVAARNAAVSEDSMSPTSASRPSSPCQRRAASPRMGRSSAEAPPRLRASSAAPVTQSASIPSAAIATAMRPASPISSERCRSTTKRKNAEVW